MQTHYGIYAIRTRHSRVARLVTVMLMAIPAENQAAALQAQFGWYACVVVTDRTDDTLPVRGGEIVL